MKQVYQIFIQMIYILKTWYTVCNGIKLYTCMFYIMNVFNF